MSLTGTANVTALATTSPLAALSELDDPAAISAPSGMSRHNDPSCWTKDK